MAEPQDEDLYEFQTVEAELAQLVHHLGAARLLSEAQVRWPDFVAQLEGDDRSLLEQAFIAILATLGLGDDDLRIKIDDRRPANRPNERPGAQDGLEIELLEWDENSRTATYELRQLGDHNLLTLAVLSLEAVRLFILLAGRHPSEFHRELKFSRPAAKIASPRRATPYREQPAQNGAEAALSSVSLSTAQCFLGMGWLGLHSVQRIHHGGENIGYWASTQWSFQSVGDLSLPAMAHLMAALAEMRDEDLPVGQPPLPPNQQAVYNRRRAALRGQRERLLVRMGLSNELADWVPKKRPRPDIDRPVNIEWLEDEELANAARRDHFNAGKNVFRVRHNQSAQWAGLGGFVGMLGSLGMFLFTPNLLHPSDWQLWTGLVTFTMLIGTCVGAQKRSDFCSDTDCKTRLPPDAEHCSACGGRVRGEIAKIADRLAAEDNLE